jgi:hypothetical protein
LATTDAIAFLGDTIRSLLLDGLSGLSPPPDVVLSTPDEFKTFAPNKPTVTVFLYHVAVCGDLRNTPRNSNFNGGRRRPPLPLELRFMITPWTKTARDAYRIVGVIVQLLYDHAVLKFNDLQGSGVWAPDDTVEFVLESLPVGEAYDIWDPTDIPYKLSLSYLARLIGIDSAVTTSATPIAVATFPKANG